MLWQTLLAVVANQPGYQKMLTPFLVLVRCRVCELRAEKGGILFIHQCLTADFVDAGSSRRQLPLAEEDWKDAKAQASASVLEWHHQLPHVGACCLLRVLLWSGGKTICLSALKILQSCACEVPLFSLPSLTALEFTALMYSNALYFASTRMSYLPQKPSPLPIRFCGGPKE